MLHFLASVAVLLGLSASLISGQSSECVEAQKKLDRIRAFAFADGSSWADVHQLFGQPTSISQGSQASVLRYELGDCRISLHIRADGRVGWKLFEFSTERPPQPQPKRLTPSIAASGADLLRAKDEVIQSLQAKVFELEARIVRLEKSSGESTSGPLEKDQASDLRRGKVEAANAVLAEKPAATSSPAVTVFGNNDAVPRPATAPNRSANQLAIEQHSDQLQRYPSDRDALWRRGEAYIGAGELQKALADFEAAAKIPDPLPANAPSVHESAAAPATSTQIGPIPETPATPPGCTSSGSCYGDISPATGRPKTVHVDGYYRKDGTYVRPHYRSTPRRRR
ncbi:MAG: hypothetical protein KIT09_00350 [Bryobacteraceae bacterium]|nr:hypothetical protein [Bryobacteraceae bacterium]